MTVAEKLAKAIDALNDLFDMVGKYPSPAIKADERFLKAGAVLGELRVASRG